MKKSNELSLSQEEATSIYSVRNSDGEYDNVLVDRFTLQAGSMSEFTETIYMQEGVSITIFNIPSEEEVSMNFDYGKGPVCFGCTINCKAVLNVTKPANREDIVVEENSIFISRQEDIKGFFHKPKGISFKMISLAFDPKIIDILFKDAKEHIEEDMLKLFDEGYIDIIHTNKASPVGLTISESIINCQYTSPKREMYIKSKAMELFWYVFTEYMTKKEPDKSSKLQEGDTDKIHQAREYIHTRISSPPTIEAISKEIGINDYKLKVGFKELFGTTIHAYIRSERMSRSKIMLESGRFSVNEVAWDLGYSNVSHFIQAFKRQYKVTPGQILFDARKELVSSKIGSSEG